MKPARKPMLRRPRTVSTRRVQLARRPAATIRNRYGQRHAQRSMRSVAMRFLVGVIILFMVFGSCLLFLRFWLIPELLFTKIATNQIVAFIPQSQETTQVLLMRLSQTDGESHIWHVTDLPMLQTADIRVLQLHLAATLGVIPDYVQTLPLPEQAIGSTTQLAAVFPSRYPWQQLLQMRTETGLQQERLAFLLQRTTVEQISAVEFAQMPISPVIQPQAARKCPIVVSNTTPVSGLAEQMSRVLERAGLLVVRTISGQEDLQQTKVVVGAAISAECQEVAQRLANGIAFEQQVSVVVDKTPQLEQYRAAILIEIGSDFYWETSP